MSPHQPLIVVAILIAVGTCSPIGLLAYAGDQPTHHDRFGDPLPEGAIARLGAARLRHGRVVQVVVVSPDGKSIASTDGEGEVVIWDALNGKELRSIKMSPCHAGHALSFSPNSQMLASGGETVSLWEVGTGREIFKVKDGEHESYRAIAFSPDGKILASGSDGHTVNGSKYESFVCLWDVRTGQKTNRFPAQSKTIEGVAFTPDGRTIASASETVRLWDVATGREMVTLGGNKYTATQVAFSPDGKWIAYGDSDGQVAVFDLVHQVEAWRLQAHLQSVETLTFSPGGEYLLSGSKYGGVHLWDLAARRELVGSAEISEKGSRGTFTPDGKSLVVCGFDNVIHVLNLAHLREQLPVAGHHHEICSVAVAPDGKLVATGGIDGLRLWDGATGKELWRSGDNKEDWISCVTFAPNGKFLASGGGERGIRFWDATTGRVFRLIQTRESHVYDLAFSPDGQRLYSSGSYLVETRDVVTGRVIWERGRSPQREQNHNPARLPYVSSLCASGDDCFVASHMRDRLRIWDADTGAEVFGLPGASCAHPSQPGRPLARSLAFSPDGATLLSTGSDDRVRHVLRRWDRSDKRGSGWQALDPFPCVSLAFGADGRTVASACKDGRVVLWDANTGKLRCTFRGHRGEVYGAVFSSDGRTVVSYGSDGTALVWDAASQAPMLAVHAGRGPEWWAFWTPAPLKERDTENPDEDNSILECVRGFLGSMRIVRWVAIAVLGLLAAYAAYLLLAKRKQRVISQS